MANNRLGELRRSTAVMTFGPGSVVDFRADGAPVSGVAAGLEEWDRLLSACGAGQPTKDHRTAFAAKTLGGRFPSASCRR